MRAAGLAVLLVALGCSEPVADDLGPFAPRCADVGVICTVAGDGSAGLGALGEPAWQQPLYLPMDAAVDAAEVVHIVDWNNHRVLRLDAEGAAEAYAGNGSLGEGAPSAAPDARAVAIYHPTDMVLLPEGGAWIALWHNDVVAAVSATGGLEVVAGNGDAGLAADGSAALAAPLGLPSKLARRPSDGALCFSEAQGHRVRCVVAGALQTVLGPGGASNPGAAFAGDGGAADAARLALPDGNSAVPAGGLCWQSDGALLVADTLNHRVRRLGPDGVVSTVAGSGPAVGEADDGAAAPFGDGGPATAARLRQPTDVACAPDGGFYIADRDHDCVRFVDAAGVIHTAAGVCGQRGSDGDGDLATAARLNRPYGVSLDGRGRLFVADTHNHRVRRVQR